MVEISKKEFLEKAIELYGKNASTWKFKCPSCNRIQSVESVRKELEEGFKPKRHPKIKKEDDIRVEQECFSNSCDWVSYGLFNSGILVRIEEDKPVDGNLKKNCVYVFPFADYDFSSADNKMD